MLKILNFALCISSFTLPLKATCPDPEFTTGYLGNSGTESGNCHTFPLPPLCAFGSLSVNQNAPLASVNRLNPHQKPITNNFQLFQNPCSIDQNVWTNIGVAAGAGVYRMRSGPYLVGMARTGPVVTVSQFNFNQNVALPNITADNRMTFFFSATETNGTGDDYFSVSTDVVNSETCVITYTPNNGSPGSITDYTITGNAFHDAYYDNLHPALAISNPPLSDGTGIFLKVDDNDVAVYPFGAFVEGNRFQFFPVRYNPLGPASFVLYAVNKNSSKIKMKISADAADHFIFTADSAYTGFLRLAALSTNDDNPTAGTDWTQTSFFMPEDVGNGSDTSNPPSSCAIEAPLCSLSPTSESWWKTAQVDAIAPTGMSFYMRIPKSWADLFAPLAVKMIGPNWVNTPGTINQPSSQGFSDILPAIALGDATVANGYFSDFLTTFPGPPFSGDACDFATNDFLLQFDILMAENLTADIQTFQTTNRSLPAYTLSTPGIDNVAIYTAHQNYIPIRAEINTTATSTTWTYTLSSEVPPEDGQNKTLVCFPFWKYLQGTTPNVVNTAPAPGEPFQNFLFNDTIKGTLYTAECLSGAVTFIEGELPSWYGYPNLFIPPNSILSSQYGLLDTALNRILNQTISLPYFPEARLDSAYNAAKTCFMLAKSAFYIAYFMQQKGDAPAAIIAQTQPFLDNAKSILTAYLIGRTPGSSFFVADRTSGGICVNGGGGDGSWANGPNLQQSVDSGEDFGNYVYNDHHFFAGYFLLATALVTNWELIYTPGQYWVELPVMGGDNQQYKIKDMVDFLWRDVHNPFKNDSSQPVYDLDLPYDRYGLPWEGHSVANGLQYQPNSLGRNQESISEDFNCWLGMNTYAALMLQIAPSSKYQTLYDFSLMNLKLNSSAGVLWYKNYNYWKGINMYAVPPATPGYFDPAIYIGQFTQATVTNGQVNDSSAQNQTFF